MHDTGVSLHDKLDEATGKQLAGESKFKRAILFLDVDGVLHPLGPNHLPLHADLDELCARVDEDLAQSDENEQDESKVLPTRVVAGEFVPECMLVLKTIVSAAAASNKVGLGIVLSTTWRETAAGRKAVKLQLSKHGIPASLVVGCTSNNGGGLNSRKAEIEEWIKRHNSINSPIFNYVVIDDADLKIDDAHFIRTDMATGLVPEDAVHAIELLSASM